MDSRVKNTKRNMISGLIKQAIMIILPFLVRTAMLYVLGSEYLGLNGLFTSVLAVLNLADLGFSSAVMFALYKPIAEKDTERICVIVNYLKCVYTIVGIVILVAGLALMPALRYLINGDVPNDVNLYILFLIYLINIVISYWLFAYKSALLTAMQRENIVNNIISAINIVLKAMQIIVLFLFKSYYAFIILLPISTVVNNLLLQYYSKKYFPEIIPKGKLDPYTRKELSKQIKAVFLGKVGDTARNSLDNIVLSLFFGLTTVAIYDNYYYIYTSLYAVTLVLTSAMQASIGNSIASETVEKNYRDLKKFAFIFAWLTGWMTITMLCLYQPFMRVWMHGRPDMMFSDFNMILFCIYFYAITMNNMRNLYVQGAGLFHECRLWYLLEAIANLVLNIVLGKLIGVSGIIIATIITIFVFNFVTRTNVLFKYYFKTSPKEFYSMHAFYACVTLIIAVGMFVLCNALSLEGFIGLVIKALFCVIIPNVIYFAVYQKFSLFKEAMKFTKEITHR